MSVGQTKVLFTQIHRMSTWHGAEGTLGVDGRLDGDDSLSLRTPALLALSLHLKQVGVVGQQVLNDHRVLRWVRYVNALHLTCRKGQSLFRARTCDVCVSARFVSHACRTQSVS